MRNWDDYRPSSGFGVSLLLALALAVCGPLIGAQRGDLKLPLTRESEIVRLEFHPTRGEQPVLSISASGKARVNPFNGRPGWQWQLNLSEVQELMHFIIVEQGFMEIETGTLALPDSRQRVGCADGWSEPINGLPDVTIRVSTRTERHEVRAELPYGCGGPGEARFARVLQRLANLSGTELPWKYQ